MVFGVVQGSFVTNTTLVDGGVVDLQLEQDAVQQMNAFAELVTYIPYNAPPRTIHAVVTRKSVGVVLGTSNETFGQQASILVYNSADGITPAEFTPKRDKVLFAIKLGDEPSERTMVTIANQDPAMIRIMVS